ncbi:hypothetical protein VN97_g5265 [Penicillium thymicola]|uniref:Uncharacterized protein n=1 Tax=Penicillium thymicola TaxID=293382 RepID=A0AAI9X9D1_PENTH|nr:hypothetical protein VN97_g5265 [Penicillium thymicola]
MVTGYWIIGSLGLDPGSVATFVGLATAIGSAGSTAAFILGACNVSLIWQSWANVITFIASVSGLLYMGFTLVTEDAVIDTATIHVDWIDTVETNETISTRRKTIFTLLQRSHLVASEILLLFRMVDSHFFIPSLN